MPLALIATATAALLLPSATPTPRAAASLDALSASSAVSSRRELLSAVPRVATLAAAASVLGGASSPALADEGFSKMGGLLEPFVDTQKGYKLYKPAGWNQFDADPGVYDVKFQDIIESETTVQVSTSPVQTATSVTALGELDEVGAKFAKSRSAEVVAASKREVEGALVYQFELKGDTYHELLALCINRGKLYRVSTVTSNKKWNKRAELYKNVVLSFVPRGY